MKHEFSRQIFEKPSNIKILEVSPERAEFFHADGRTDRRDEAKSRFLQSCETVQKRTIP